MSRAPAWATLRAAAGPRAELDQRSSSWPVRATPGNEPVSEDARGGFVGGQEGLELELGKGHVGCGCERSGQPALQKIELEVEGEVPGIDPDRYRQIAEAAKASCAISRALTDGVEEITVSARLRASS
jgi:hypothetical protein